MYINDSSDLVNHYLNQHYLNRLLGRLLTSHWVTFLLHSSLTLPPRWQSTRSTPIPPFLVMFLRVGKHAMRIFCPTSLLLPSITLQLPLLRVSFYHSLPQIYLLIFLHIRGWSHIAKILPSCHKALNYWLRKATPLSIQNQLLTRHLMSNLPPPLHPPSHGISISL